MSNVAQKTTARDEAELREIFDRWAEAVRAQDYDAIRKNHAVDILMFDVPPPFLSQGIESYMETWKLFFDFASKPVIFDFEDLRIHAGSEVAFATAIGHCYGTDTDGVARPLDFRLTMGFRKVDGRWMIVHEHHSLPAVS